jgi:hypothetical protein
MAMNNVTPSQEREISRSGELSFPEVPRYRCSEDFADRVARGILDIKYLDLSGRFKSCEDASHVRDVLMAEGDLEMFHLSSDSLWDFMDEKDREAYEFKFEEQKPDHVRRKKAARERVKKRRQRTH